MGRPKYILLVRHGESEGNCDKLVNRHIPNHRVALTPKGHGQAREAGRVLKTFLEQPCFDPDVSGSHPRQIMFYTSPYTRARQTCKHIVEGIRNVEGLSHIVHEEPRMREQDFGNFQSTPDAMEQIWEERAHYGHFFYRIPHGESAADVYDRVASFNELLFRQFLADDDFPSVLVLVTHGIWARVFLMKWFRWLYEYFESLRNIPHAQFLVMKRGEDSHRYCLKTRMLTWDDVPEEEVDLEVAKELGDEVSFNSRSKLVHPDDLDVRSIIQSQAAAIRINRERTKIIKQKYDKTIGVDMEKADTCDNFEGSMETTVHDPCGKSP